MKEIQLFSHYFQYIFSNIANLMIKKYSFVTADVI